VWGAPHWKRARWCIPDSELAAASMFLDASLHV
jgi:hypothetical protein